MVIIYYASTRAVQMPALAAHNVQPGLIVRATFVILIVNHQLLTEVME